MTKFRPAASSAPLDEMMARVFELPDREALIAYLQTEYEFWGPTEANVEVEFYARDDRSDWDTYLVTIDSKAALFCDGPVE